MHLVDQHSTSTFTTQELARLAAYRAAVEAGFFTDWDGTAASTDARLLARLRRVEQRAVAQPFSAQERQRLVRMRRRLARGGYAEDCAPPAMRPDATTEGAGPLSN
jgi:hypothetical protein